MSNPKKITIKTAKLTSSKSAKLKSAKGAKLKVNTIEPAAFKASPAAPPKLDSPKLTTIGGTSSKETIYVDVDDEITAIIDKVGGAKGSIIALVLPKRASVLQSVVNMKLLKRTAEESSKNLVLVTNEASLLPLAGMIGLHVAETPSSKPVIPPAPDSPNDEPESVDEPLDINDSSISPSDDFDPEAVADKPIGELAGLTPAVSEATEEVIVDDGSGDLDTVNHTTRPDVVPVRKNKKLTVPSFEKFRLRMVLGVLLLCGLVAGWMFATKVLPKATVAIQTNSQVVKSSLNLTLDTAAKAVDAENGIIPAVAQTAQKNYTQQVPATGQQNNGDKASGSVVFEASDCTLPAKKPSDIPAGSSVRSNGHTYITQEGASFSLSGVDTCVNYKTAKIDIIALKAGADYNLAAGSEFSGAGVGTGSASGGSDDIVKVVAQADIDSAKSKIAAQDATALKQELQAALQAKGLLPVTSTFLAGEQKVTSSANPGDTAETVAVSAVVPYSMLGIKQLDLQSLVTESVNEQIDSKKQKILDDGIAKAVFSQQTPATASSAVVTVKVQSVAGPEIQIATLKQQIAGKKAHEIKQIIGGLPGVTNVEVSYGPFWVSSAPKDVSKITVEVSKPALGQ